MKHSVLPSALEFDHRRVPGLGEHSEQGEVAMPASPALTGIGTLPTAGTALLGNSFAQASFRIGQTPQAETINTLVKG